MATESLGALRAELRSRLGFSAAGASGGVNQENLNSFLRRAQGVLYWLVEWAHLRRYTDQPLGLNQFLLDYPTTANRDRIKAISVLDIEANQWSKPLEKGIAPELYTSQANTTRPYRYEAYEQIELFPKANKPYTVRVFFIRTLFPFTQDTHFSTLDSDLIFTVALANAKAHYRQPDAATYTAERDALIIKLKGKNWGKDVFSPYDYIEEPLAKPVTI